MAFGLVGSIIGILLILFAIFAIFFFPHTVEQQMDYFSRNGIIFGFICLIVGIYLVFF